MKTVIVVPYGRKRYTELLIPQLLNFEPDEIRLWMNTDVVEDIEYAESIKSDIITLEYLPDGEKPSCDGRQLHKFFLNCVDDDTVYVRFDDDIILVDDKEAFDKFIQFRKDHIEFFLVYGNILNNAAITNLHQKNGTIPIDQKVEFECLDDIGWKDPIFAENLHRYILSKNANLKQFYMPNYIVKNFKRVSINCVSWFGRQFGKFGGVVHEHEEEFISTVMPLKTAKPICIYGEFVCVHYAFHTQRKHMDENTDILQKYKDVIRTK